jgi:uncharacterized membrane protein
MTPGLRALKTTLVGGIVFLLPLIVILALLGKALALVVKAAAPIAAAIPAERIGGLAIGTAVGILLLLAICYGAGLLARAAVGRVWSASFEDKLHAIYPRYTVIKGMTQGLRGAADEDELKPVLVSFDDRQAVGYEVERTADGRAVVFLPGAPDPWSGSLAIVAPERVQPMAATVKQVNKSLTGIGTGTAGLLDAQPPARRSALSRGTGPQTPA